MRHVVEAPGIGNFADGAMNQRRVAKRSLTAFETQHPDVACNWSAFFGEQIGQITRRYAQRAGHDRRRQTVRLNIGRNIGLGAEKLGHSGGRSARPRIRHLACKGCCHKIDAGACNPLRRFFVQRVQLVWELADDYRGKPSNAAFSRDPRRRDSLQRTKSPPQFITRQFQHKVMKSLLKPGNVRPGASNRARSPVSRTNCRPSCSALVRPRPWTTIKQYSSRAAAILDAERVSSISSDAIADSWSCPNGCV